MRIDTSFYYDIEVEKVTIGENMGQYQYNAFYQIWFTVSANKKPTNRRDDIIKDVINDVIIFITQYFQCLDMKNVKKIK